MINGAHVLLYAKDASKARRFFRDTLGYHHVDAGDGWLIFRLPPAEVGIHPAMDDGKEFHELYLMCDDVEKTVVELRAKGVEVTQPVTDQGWGITTAIRVPGAGEVSLYQPRHPVAATIGGAKPAKKPASSKSAAKKSAKKAPARKRSLAKAGSRRR